MKKTKKPSCSDFIVATIKKFRPKKRLGQTGWSGKSLRYVRSIVKLYYEEEEFLFYLNELLRKNILLFIKKDPVSGREIITHIDLLGMQQLLKKGSLYVIGDGLPDSVSNFGSYKNGLELNNPRNRKKAKDVMSALESKK